MNMAEEILRVENLHVKVEDTPILHGLSLTVNRGEKHVIIVAVTLLDVASQRFRKRFI